MRAAGIWRFVREDRGAWDRERLLIVVLDQTQQIVGVGEVPAATVTAEEVRRILRGIALTRAAGFVSVHSQPAGSRSAKDAAVLRRLKTIAKEIGVPLLDHVRFRRGRCDTMTPGGRGRW